MGEPEYPVDWCLKTKMRFVSARPFKWCTSLKSTEEAAGINAFVRGSEPQINEKVQVSRLVDYKRTINYLCSTRNL